MCLAYSRAYVLTCWRAWCAHVLTCLMCFYVLCVLSCLRVVCSRAYVSMYLPYSLPCSHASHACQLLWLVFYIWKDKFPKILIWGNLFLFRKVLRTYLIIYEGVFCEKNNGRKPLTIFAKRLHHRFSIHKLLFWN